MRAGAVSFLLLLPVFLFCLGAGWNERDDATGSWNGLRSRLGEKYRLHIDVDYTAESFNHNSDGESSYPGNLDLGATIEMKKLGFLRDGTFVLYGQQTHQEFLMTFS